MSLVSAAVVMQHDRDPKEIVMEEVAPYLADIEVNSSDILWVAYQRNGKTAKGVWVPPSVKQEDAIQGIVGLIVQVGPKFAETTKDRFANQPKVGDWAVIDTRHGMQMKLGQGHARIVNGDMIYAIVKRPDIVM